MRHKKALAFVSIAIIAVVFVLKTVHVLHTGGYPVGKRDQPETDHPSKVADQKTAGPPTVVKTRLNVAICILSRRNAWKRRHLVRQTWLQDVPEGVQVSHVFVMGEDKSYSREENEPLVNEVEKYQDILITTAEESPITVSEETKQCIYWVTERHDFDILIKADDDSTLFLSRLVGPGGWLSGVGRDDFIYFGRKHPATMVANPVNFNADQPVNTLTDFEFDYRGMYWPEYMEGGMYGFSRRLATEIVKNDFGTYTREDAMVGVWVAGLNADTLYLGDDQVVHHKSNFKVNNGSRIVASFQTGELSLASMWCEYASMGSLSQSAVLVKDVQRALMCLRSYEGGQLMPRSQALGASKHDQEETVKALKKGWPVGDHPPDPSQCGRWWSRMAGIFRKRSAALIGKSPTVDRLPLYMLRDMHSLVLDDFFRVADRYEQTTWVPSMYMCVDPGLCASDQGEKEALVPIGGGDASREPRVVNADSANRFARSMFAAFYIMNNVDGVKYWQHLRQRPTAHWFNAGTGENTGDEITAEAGGVDGVDRPGGNFATWSHRSGVAMGIEVLSYLGFSTIYVTAAREEIDEFWDEVSNALQRASNYGTEVIYLFAHTGDTLAKSKFEVSRGKPGKLSAQEEFSETMRKTLGPRGILSNWDLHLLLENLPVKRLQIVRDADSVKAMFPTSPVCQDAEDLDRFQKAVLCSVTISLKHFSSFLAWHVPYGPVRGMFIWCTP